MGIAMTEQISAGAVETTTRTASFEQIIRCHQSMVYSIALHFLLDCAAAEELAQDVFLQLYANLDKLQSQDHIRFWLRRVTAHRCIDYRRRCHPGQVRLEDVPEPSAPARGNDPLLERKLRRLVATLPENPRIVIILRYQEDMSAEEIAGTLQMPLATVKSHLQRSLALLREKLRRAVGEIEI